ncbi:FecR domain-containing protein [Pandoraea pnomenusa]|uniref:FecR domain-containing protein n=1 Tax=Pandoraea pnomenusa TaxID=93220 RepID=UPI00333F92FE
MPAQKDSAFPHPSTLPPVPPSRAALDQAVEWFTVLKSGDAGEREHAQWSAWLRASGEHRVAWEKVESVFGRIRELDVERAYRTLTPYSPHAPTLAEREHRARRRSVVKGLALTGLLLGAGGIATRSQIALAISADYRTGKGETKSVRLRDGSSLFLDTETAVSTRFRDGRREIELLQGQVCVRMASHAARSNEAPLLALVTEHGVIRTSGADFMARVHPDHTRCVVLRERVDISSAETPHVATTLRQGEQVDFRNDVVGPIQPSGDTQAAWLHGQIVADNMTLAAFVNEVARYRTGVVRVSPDVADLRISGAFPITDTDRILASLPRVLPVRIRSVTRYWTMIDASH